jgi:hypothetical protein
MVPARNYFMSGLFPAGSPQKYMKNAPKELVPAGHSKSTVGGTGKNFYLYRKRDFFINHNFLRDALKF